MGVDHAAGGSHQELLGSKDVQSGRLSRQAFWPAAGRADRERAGNKTRRDPTHATALGAGDGTAGDLASSLRTSCGLAERRTDASGTPAKPFAADPRVYLRGAATRWAGHARIRGSVGEGRPVCQAEPVPPTEQKGIGFQTLRP
jgi:hypothetical protein